MPRGAGKRNVPVIVLHSMTCGCGFKSHEANLKSETLVFSFTLYSTCYRVGRGNLVLRYSVPNSPSIFLGIEC